jgi:hypothetical protein
VAVPVQRAPSWAHAALPPDPEAAAPVRLGFADGSQLELRAEDPRARALRAVADSLVQDSSAPAEN